MTRVSAGALLFALCAGVASAHADAPVLYHQFAGASEDPESITFDEEGHLFVSVGSTVRKLHHDGTLQLWSTVPNGAFALGVKVGPDGCVYNASTSLDPSVNGAFVWRTCTPGDIEQYAALDPTGGPNDLAFDAEGNVYVTDPILGKIFKVDASGAVSVWLDDALLKGNPADPALVFSQQGVNGVALDADQTHLYVGNLDYGRILKIKIKPNGKAGAIDVVAEDPALRGADGIAFDKDEKLYVAVGAQFQLVSVTKHGVVKIVSDDALLRGPSSVAFGSTHHQHKTLYVCDSDFLRAFGILTDEPASPNIVTLRRKTGGLPLLD